LDPKPLTHPIGNTKIPELDCDIKLRNKTQHKDKNKTEKANTKKRDYQTKITAHDNE
jgi:hypothetical protein